MSLMYDLHDLMYVFVLCFFVTATVFGTVLFPVSFIFFDLVSLKFSFSVIFFSALTVIPFVVLLVASVFFTITPTFCSKIFSVDFFVGLSVAGCFLWCISFFSMYVFLYFIFIRTTCE